MNKRELRKALKQYDPHHPTVDTNELLGRKVAMLISVSNTPPPRPLRLFFNDAALACLRCDTYDYAPDDAPPFTTFHAARADAFAKLGDAAYAHYTRRRVSAPPQDEAANG